MHRLRQIAYFSKETANSDWMSVLQGFVNKRQQQQIDPFGYPQHLHVAMSLEITFG